MDAVTCVTGWWYRTFLFLVDLDQDIGGELEGDSIHHQKKDFGEHFILSMIEKEGIKESVNEI